MSEAYHPVVFRDKRLSFVCRDASKIPSVLSKLYGVKVCTFDLSYNNIHNLTELENFPNLEELILDNNLLDDFSTLPHLSSLRTLSLNNNKIADLDLILSQIKSKMPNLEYLSLLGNIACPNELSDIEKDEEDYQRYRYYVVHNLPKLKFLDHRTITLHERLEAQRKGKYMKIARPSLQSFMSEKVLDEDKFPYTPLPEVERCNTGLHQGIYGRRLYRYTGKNSEGNRFIRNNDL